METMMTHDKHMTAWSCPVCNLLPFTPVIMKLWLAGEKGITNTHTHHNLVAYRNRLMFERKRKKGGGGLQKNERDEKEEEGKEGRRRELTSLSTSSRLSSLSCPRANCTMEQKRNYPFLMIAECMVVLTCTRYCCVSVSSFSLNVTPAMAAAVCVCEESKNVDRFRERHRSTGSCATVHPIHCW